MSADLLRRAAAKLREHVQDISELWRDNEWFPVFTDSESLTGVRTCSKSHTADMRSDACDWCDHIETYAEPLAAFVALMQPPVALGFANLLQFMSVYPSSAEAPDESVYNLAVHVAHLVLREDGESA